MSLTQQLTHLQLQPGFIKQLNQDDILFASKQYQKLYAQQMSKLSSKLYKIQKVKQNLIHIENQQNDKINKKKLDFDQKISYIEKNKQKFITQKLKTTKLYHQFWENKVTNIKKKNKQYLKLHADKSSKFSSQIQKFWKTKTSQLFSQQKKLKYLQLNRKSRQRSGLKLLTEGSQLKQNKIKLQKLSNKQKDQIGSKTIRFSTQNNKQYFEKQRKNNQSNFSQKYSIPSLRDLRQNTQKSIKMPHLDQNKFSQKLHSNQKNKTLYNMKSYKQTIDDDQNHGHKKLSIRNELLQQQKNTSFQKAMKKLDKIYQLKQMNTKRLETKQTSLSPCKPRKSIDADQYRMLRANSEVKKNNKKNNSDQNAQNNHNQIKQNNLISKTIRNNTLARQSRFSPAKTIHGSRISKNLQHKQQQRQHERNALQRSQINRWKKQKIIKAIKGRINKIKLQQMNKLKQKQNI